MSWVWLAHMNRYTAGVNQPTMLLSFIVIVSAHYLHPRVVFLWKLKFKRVIRQRPNVLNWKNQPVIYLLLLLLFFDNANEKSKVDSNRCNPGDVVNIFHQHNLELHDLRGILQIKFPYIQLSLWMCGYLEFYPTIRKALPFFIMQVVILDFSKFRCKMGVFVYLFVCFLSLELASSVTRYP